MNGGRIEQSGSPLELYDRPVNKFVAGFLGSPAMNFIPGMMERGDGAPRMRTQEGFTIPVGDTAAASGQEIEIGIRPEHFRLADGKEIFPYRIAVVEPTGSETHLFGTVAGIGVRCVFRDRIAPEPGSQMMLTVDPAKVHVFDRRTGVRI